MHPYAKYFAECLGTFGLTLAVIISLGGHGALATPVVAALTLCLFVYSVGHISGTHINPAVTIGLFSLGKMNFRDTAIYIGSQLLGAVLALVVARTMVQSAAPVIDDTIGVFCGELVGTFFFTFGIAAVVYNRVPSTMNGLVIGGSLLSGILLASAMSNGVLNPAVALGIGSFSWTYLFGPIVGSVLGMQAFAFLSGERRG